MTTPTPSPMFAILFDGPHGLTQYADDPRLEAYKQAAYYQTVYGLHCSSLTCHADGSYTIAVDGSPVAPLTFAPFAEDPEPEAAPVLTCKQCNKPMNPADYLTGPVCLKCARHNHARIAGR